MGMNDINSLSHTKWNCKYHFVFAAVPSKGILLLRKRAKSREKFAAVMRMEGSKVIAAEACPSKHTIHIRRNPTKDSSIELYGGTSKARAYRHTTRRTIV